nr:cytosolic Fe-S cluster assembly factor NBP35 [Tanacetum cinerariifolium]
MSTRSSARNIFLPLDNPELTIRRRFRAGPTLLSDFEMAVEGNGDPPVPEHRTMEELCQPSLSNSFQFDGLLGDDANKHLDKFLHVTQSIKVNGVIDDALRLNEITNFRQRPDESLFEAWERYKLSIDRCLAEAIATACYTQNRSIIHRCFVKTPYELINGKKPNISFLYVFGALCYPKNDREDIGKLGAKGDIGFFIGYSANSCAYRVYNRKTKKIMETINVTFNEISAMAFEQHSLKPGLQSTTSVQINSGLDLLFASSTITSQQPTEEHLYPSCEKGKSKKAPHPPKPVPNSKQRLHLLHMDLCGPIRIASINGKRKPNIYFLYVFGALCYPKNDHEDIGKLGAKGLDLLFASSTITSQQPTEGELDLLFEAIYDGYSGGQPSTVPRTDQAAQANPNVEEHNATNDMFDGNKFVNPFATPSTSAAVSSSSPYDILAYAAHKLFTVFQMNVKMAFLHGTLKEDVYVCRPKGFIDADNPIHVYKLKKALYGLKQAPRAWYDELSTFLLLNQFFKGTIDPTLFIRLFEDNILVVQVYVDDIIFGSTDPKPDIVHATCLCGRYQSKLIEKHLKEVKKIFHYLRGAVNLGLWRKAGELVIEETRLYGVVNSKSRICVPICLLCPSPLDADTVNGLWLSLPQDSTLLIRRRRYNLIPAESKFKNLMLDHQDKYMMKAQGTVNTGLWYTKDSGFELIRFSDADYAGCKDNFKSTSSGAQFLGEKLLTDYGYHFSKIPIYCDSKSAIAISCNPVQHSRTKHIAVRYHFIKEHVEKGMIELYFVKTDYQLADIFTKALLVDRFNYLVRRLEADDDKGSETKDEKDLDYVPSDEDEGFVDDEYAVDDVHVNMKHFKLHIAQEENLRMQGNRARVLVVRIKKLVPLVPKAGSRSTLITYSCLTRDILIDLIEIAERMATVKHKILILSGKGGVGKSTFAAQLSFALAAMDHEVGLLDIDICGPSILKMLGLEGQDLHVSNLGVSPVYVDSIGVISIAFRLSDPNEAVILRGSRKSIYIKEFVRDANWGELDFLVVDAPPGTSDEQLAIVQLLKETGIDGVIILTTPQQVSLIDNRKMVNFCKDVGIQILGVIENMSGLSQPLSDIKYMKRSMIGEEPEDVTKRALEIMKEKAPELLDFIACSEVFDSSGGGAARMCAETGSRFLEKYHWIQSYVKQVKKANLVSWAMIVDETEADDDKGSETKDEKDLDYVPSDEDEGFVDDDDLDDGVNPQKKEHLRKLERQGKSNSNSTFNVANAGDPDILTDFVAPNNTIIDANYFTFTGLVHFQYNNSTKEPALAISAFGSANAGTQSIPTSIFNSSIFEGILDESFHAKRATIRKIEDGLKA